MSINVITVPVGPLGVNCYIVSDLNNDKALIIDPGGDFYSIKQKLNEINKQAGAVIVTHCHFDHVLAVSDFQKEDVPVYMHFADEDFITSNGNLAKYFGLKMNLFTLNNRLIGGFFDICGYKVQIIETPGHTDGSICIIIDNYLFSGDTLFFGSYGRTDFPSGSKLKLINSAKKLFALERDYIVCPGHDSKTTLYNEKKNNPIRMLFED